MAIEGQVYLEYPRHRGGLRYEVPASHTITRCPACNEQILLQCEHGWGGTCAYHSDEYRKSYAEKQALLRHVDALKEAAKTVLEALPVYSVGGSAYTRTEKLRLLVEEVNHGS